MNRKEVKGLYEKLAKDFNVSVPEYRLRSVKTVKKRNPPTKQELKELNEMSIDQLVDRIKKRLKREKLYCFFYFDMIGSDEFHMIVLSESSKGFRRDFAIHEFIHYLEWYYGFPHDEKRTRNWTRKLDKSFKRKKKGNREL